MFDKEGSIFFAKLSNLIINQFLVNSENIPTNQNKWHDNEIHLISVAHSIDNTKLFDNQRPKLLFAMQSKHYI